MCVICYARDVRPTDDQVRAMWEANRDGGGFAWREKDNKGRILVHWEKGIDSMADMLDAAKKLPLPYVAHFRIQTCGGALKCLTHPFGIDENASIALEGTTDRGVLFHNGHFNRWKEAVREFAISTGNQIPGGAWSDSRAMAWLIHHLGDGMVEFFEEKLILFGPDKVYFGNAGSFIREDGLLVSNLGWKSKLRSSSMYLTAPRSMAGEKKDEANGNKSDDKEDHPQTGCVGVPHGVTDPSNTSTTGSTDRSSSTEGTGGSSRSPFVKRGLTPGNGKWRIPETGEACGKRKCKRWQKALGKRAAAGDRAAAGWLDHVQRFPLSVINPEYWPQVWDPRTPAKPTTKPSPR
jgi:hypothetical protein